MNTRTQTLRAKNKLRWQNFNTMYKIEDIPKPTQVCKLPSFLKLMDVLYKGSVQYHGDTKLNNRRLSEAVGVCSKTITRYLAKAEKGGLIAMVFQKMKRPPNSPTKGGFYTIRTIRCHMILALHRYEVIKDLGYKVDIRPMKKEQIAQARSVLPRKYRIPSGTQEGWVYDPDDNDANARGEVYPVVQSWHEDAADKGYVTQQFVNDMHKLLMGQGHGHANAMKIMGLPLEAKINAKRLAKKKLEESHVGKTQSVI